MNRYWKRKWLDALKSGEYTKKKGQLRAKTGKRMCCLGVLCDIHPEVRWEEGWSPISSTMARYGNDWGDVVLPWSFRRDLDITDKQEGILANLNDEYKGWTKVVEYIKNNM